ncbi:hypothetical protein BKA62DRAFT_828307 [Auriculariales sp. MPI-PUGE-AT-0066]|nr:hypothetical protein BKA62DRAFT_828307 [Auriculariales sp. MPI-PUGE-AT-0066]
MFAKTFVVTALAAFAAARFGQEQSVAQLIAAAQGGAPGVAPTLAGGSPGVLLAATNACDKLVLADRIVKELNGDPTAIAAAQALVAAEKNFNPFVVSIPAICSDASLPASPELRGITPLVDPDVVGSDAANALSKQTLADPLCATGLSIADLLERNGFTNFTRQAPAGSRRRSRLNKKRTQRIRRHSEEKL